MARLRNDDRSPAIPGALRNAVDAPYFPLTVSQVAGPLNNGNHKTGPLRIPEKSNGRRGRSSRPAKPRHVVVRMEEPKEELVQVRVVYENVNVKPKSVIVHVTKPEMRPRTILVPVTIYEEVKPRKIRATASKKKKGRSKKNK